MAKRGCGERTKGGIYIECPVGDVGMPVEHFLVDEPIRVDANQMGLSAVGVKVVPMKGIWHVFDIVGQEFYPNVADFVEEVRRLGLSRKVAPTTEFKKLTPQSKIILLHARAYDNNYQHYPKETLFPCPKNACNCGECRAIARQHAIPKGGKSLPCACAATWWHNIEGGEPASRDSLDVVRVMPSFEYAGHARPPRIKKPDYSLAIFMRLPINNFAVIRDPEHGTHEMAEAKASESSIPVMLKDE